MTQCQNSLTLRWCSHSSHRNSLCKLNNCMQSIKYTVLTSIIAFVCIIVCIQQFCYLSIIDPLRSTLSEWEMMWPYHIPALSAGNWWHVDHFTSFSQIWLGFLTIPYPAPALRFRWRSTSNFKFRNDVHQVSPDRYAVEYMDAYGMTVVVQIDWSCALTARSMTRMTSVTQILIAHFVTTIAVALSLNSN
jgi:hypothetical protein